jgi:hypothetical protein
MLQFFQSHIGAAVPLHHDRQVSHIRAAEFSMSLSLQQLWNSLCLRNGYLGKVIQILWTFKKDANVNSIAAQV